MSSVPEVSSEERELYQGVSDTPTSYVREGADVHPPPDFAPYKSTALRHPKEPLVYSAAVDDGGDGSAVGG